MSGVRKLRLHGFRNNRHQAGTADIDYSLHAGRAEARQLHCLLRSSTELLCHWGKYQSQIFGRQYAGEAPLDLVQSDARLLAADIGCNLAALNRKS